MKRSLNQFLLVVTVVLLPTFSRAAHRLTISQNDTATLKLDAQKAKEAGDLRAMDQAVSSYIAELNGKYTRDEFIFLRRYATSTQSEAFRFFFKNQQLVDKIAGADFTRNQIEFLVHQDFLKKATTGDVPVPDWKELERKVKPFGPPGQHIFDRTRWSFYYHKKDWNRFVTYLADYINRYPDRADKMLINDRLWDLYEANSDKDLLNKAAKIQKRIIELGLVKFDRAVCMDTYACIRYRAGDGQEALAWIQKAVDLLKDLSSDEFNKDSAAEIQGHLKMIQNNEPTWPVDKDKPTKG